MDKRPFYTAKRAEEVALGALEVVQEHFYSTEASPEEDSRVRNLTENILEETFSREVEILSSTFGTKRRKTMKAVTKELTRRGISWTDVFEDMSWINVNIGGTRFRIDIFMGLSLALLPPDGAMVPVKLHRCNAGACDLVDFLSFFSMVKPKIAEGIRRKVLLDHRSAMLCEIEFPFVKQTVRRFLDPTGLSYHLQIQCAEIFLEVQLDKDSWTRNALSAQNVEQVLQLVQYFIEHPDCIRRDSNGFSVVRTFSQRM